MSFLLIRLFEIKSNLCVDSKTTAYNGLTKTNTYVIRNVISEQGIEILKQNLCKLSNDEFIVVMTDKLQFTKFIRLLINDDIDISDILTITCLHQQFLNDSLIVANLMACNPIGSILFVRDLIKKSST